MSLIWAYFPRVWLILDPVLKWVLRRWLCQCVYSALVFRRVYSLPSKSKMSGFKARAMAKAHLCISPPERLLHFSTKWSWDRFHSVPILTYPTKVSTRGRANPTVSLLLGHLVSWISGLRISWPCWKSPLAFQDGQQVSEAHTSHGISRRESYSRWHPYRTVCSSPFHRESIQQYTWAESFYYFWYKNKLDCCTNLKKNSEMVTQHHLVLALPAYHPPPSRKKCL